MLGHPYIGKKLNYLDQLSTMCILHEAELLECNPHLPLEGIYGGSGRNVLVGGIIGFIIVRGVLICRLL